MRLGSGHQRRGDRREVDGQSAERRDHAARRCRSKRTAWPASTVQSRVARITAMPVRFCAAMVMTNSGSAIFNSASSVKKSALRSWSVRQRHAQRARRQAQRELKRQHQRGRDHRERDGVSSREFEADAPRPPRIGPMSAGELRRAPSPAQGKGSMSSTPASIAAAIWPRDRLNDGAREQLHASPRPATRSAATMTNAPTTAGEAPVDRLQRSSRNAAPGDIDHAKLSGTLRPPDDQRH